MTLAITMIAKSKT